MIGYPKLKSFQDWNEHIALKLAENEKIIMRAEHWEVIYFIREFYAKFNTSPNVRTLVHAMLKKYGKEKGNSIYLFHLFPQGPAKQANKIAGIPKSARCL